MVKDRGMMTVRVVEMMTVEITRRRVSLAIVPFGELVEVSVVDMVVTEIVGKMVTKTMVLVGEMTMVKAELLFATVGEIIVAIW